MCHHSSINLHRSFSYCQFFKCTNQHHLTKTQQKKSLHSFTWQCSTHIAWQNGSKKTQVFCRGHMAFTDYTDTWKTLINQRSKYVYCLVFVMHQLMTLTVTMDFLIYSVYSIIFPLLIAVRAKSATSTSCTPNMVFERSQSYIRQSYRVVANCFQVMFQKQYYFHIIRI